MIEDEWLPDLTIDTPVQALHEISWDPTLQKSVRMADGRTVTALDLQWEYLDHAKKWVKENEETPRNAEILDRWEGTLGALEDDPMKLHRELDWVAKYRLIEGFRERDGLEWDDPKLALIDLQYHDVRRDKGLYYRLVKSNKIERLVSEAEVTKAANEPPEDTRAYFRGIVHPQVPGRDHGGLMGLDHLRHRDRRAPAGPDARTAARHPRACREPLR